MKFIDDKETIRSLLYQAFEFGQMHPVTTNPAATFDAWYAEHARQLRKDLRAETSLCELDDQRRNGP